MVVKVAKSYDPSYDDTAGNVRNLRKCALQFIQ